MPKIIIANNDTAGFFSDHRVFTEAFCLEGDRLAARMLWFAESGDIVIVPRRPAAAFLDYMAKIGGYAPDEIMVIAVEDFGRGERRLEPQVFLDPHLLEILRLRMTGRTDWSFFFYAADRTVRDFAAALGVTDPANVRFFAEGGSEIVNDKRLFRTLAAARGIDIAEGSHAVGSLEMQQAVTRHIALTGTVILKQDRHQGGLGNVIITRDPDGPRLGAADRFVVDRDGSLFNICVRAWNILGHSEKAVIIVESYFEAEHVFTSEFNCVPAASRVDFLNWGHVRQAPVFSGLVMPPSAPAYLGGRFVSGGTEIARLATDLGYHGPINIDAIALHDGRIIFNEWNGRIGGCSHLHRLGEILAGRYYGDRLVLASRKIVGGGDLDTCLRLLDFHGLGYCRTHQRGIVLSYADPGAGGELEIVTLASTEERVRELEEEFERLLADAMQSFRSEVI